MCSKITCLKATTCQKRYCSILLNTRKNVKKKGKVLHLLQVMGGGIARSVTTLAGNRMDDNFVALSVNKDENSRE